MPTFPEGATDEERARLDDLWGDEQKCIAALQAFVMSGCIGKAKQKVAEAEKVARELEREGGDLRRSGAGKPRLAEWESAHDAAVAEVELARAELNVVLAEKQTLVDAREEPKVERHALRSRIHTRGAGRRRQEAAV